MIGGTRRIKGSSSHPWGCHGYQVHILTVGHNITSHHTIQLFLSINHKVIHIILSKHGWQLGQGGQKGYLSMEWLQLLSAHTHGRRWCNIISSTHFSSIYHEVTNPISFKYGWRQRRGIWWGGCNFQVHAFTFILTSCKDISYHPFITPISCIHHNILHVISSKHGW